MGKSRLSLKSAAFRRQKNFFSEDTSRHLHNQIKISDPLNSLDDDNMSYSPHQTVHISFEDFKKYVDILYNKRGSTREKALLELVNAFERSVLVKFVETTCITILDRCINSIKVGSVNEARLAFRAIGLLAITVGEGSSAHELMEDTRSQVSQALKSGSDSLEISVLDCLAITSFFGANDVEEVENSMEIIWETCHPKSSSKIGPMIAVGISAWSFLLTTINVWRINSKLWKESLSLFSTLLESCDGTVRIAAGEAISLIYEIGRLDKFSKEQDDAESVDNADSEPQRLAYIEPLKYKILTQVKKLSKEAEGKDNAKRDLNSQHQIFQEILVFLETGICPKISLRVSNKRGILEVSTWKQSVRLKFLKRFLGSGFHKHMQDNEVLHDVFDFGSREKENPIFKEKLKFKAPIASTNKERTQLRNMQRTWAQERHHGYGHYAADCPEEQKEFDHSKD